MKELIEYIATSIVNAPDEVRVKEIRAGDSVVVQLVVAPEDVGKVIGKQGRVAQATRALLKVASMKKGLRASLEIG
ncbi:MAG: KH domain-containing protein [Dehalococcoidia bacterium]|nr:KH domain-containing protein [Dehalococcoidia bacterium]